MTQSAKNLKLLFEDFIQNERTSLSKHEAVELLMEISNLQVPRLKPVDPSLTPEELEIIQSITVFDLLKDMVDEAEADYDDARYSETKKTNDIAAKLLKWESCKSLLAKGHEFLCNIDDALSVGELRTSHYQPNFITLKSFMEWAKKFQDSSNTIPNKLDKKRKEGKQILQQKAIKKVLIEDGYDLMNLPEPKNGLPGPKALIKQKVTSDKSLFSSNKVYGMAWQGLLDLKEIAYAETHPTQKKS